MTNVIKVFFSIALTFRVSLLCVYTLQKKRYSLAFTRTKILIVNRARGRKFRVSLLKKTRWVICQEVGANQSVLTTVACVN